MSLAQQVIRLLTLDERLAGTGYYLLLKTPIEEVRPTRVSTLTFYGSSWDDAEELRHLQHIRLVHADVYRRYKAGLSSYGAHDPRFNYIYRVARPLRLFQLDAYNLRKLIDRGVLSVDLVRRFWGLADTTTTDDLIRFLLSKRDMMGHPILMDVLGCIDPNRVRDLTAMYDGFEETRDSFTDVSVWWDVALTMRLVDGNVMRHTTPQAGEAPDIPEWIITELMRYQDKAASRLDKDAAEWCQKNIPKPYESVVAYRAVKASFDDWGSYEKVDEVKSLKILKRYFGWKTWTDIRPGAPVVLKRGQPSSWSSSPVVATNFAMDMAEDSVNVLVKATIPAEMVVIDMNVLPDAFRRKFPYWTQGEIIVATGAVKGVANKVWFEDKFVTWLTGRGYSVKSGSIKSLPGSKRTGVLRVD